MEINVLELLSAIGKNFLITIISIALPLGIGILLSFFASKNKIVNNIFGWISLPFECICPLALLLVNYFVVHNGFHFSGQQPLLVCVLTFLTAFIGYMPARYVSEYSFLKNVLYNGLGLFSAVFKWSLCVSYITADDLLKYCRSIVSKTYNTVYLWIPLLICFVVIIIPEIARRLVKQFMK